MKTLSLFWKIGLLVFVLVAVAAESEIHHHHRCRKRTSADRRAKKYSGAIAQPAKQKPLVRLEDPLNPSSESQLIAV